MKPSKLKTIVFLAALLLSMPGAAPVAAERGSITGNVYCDRDKNGVCDCEEGGLKGITVEIFTEHCGGTPLQSVSTDEKGNFTFESFDPGTYFVMVDIEYVCGGRVPTTASCRQVQLVDGETVTLPAFGYTEFGQ
jgi:hypothetical protein